MRNAGNYVNQPPTDIPFYLFKHRVGTWRKVIQWANEEFQLELRYCAERGYWRSLKWLNENSSAYRMLAELDVFRKMCANITQEVWDQFTPRERRFIRRAFELNQFLRQDAPQV